MMALKRQNPGIWLKVQRRQRLGGVLNYYYRAA
jgi:hypothetical protein